MFVYKHTETIEYVKKYLRKLQILRANNSIILSIQNAKFSGYFYMNTDIWRDFQICISVPLSKFDQKEREAWKHLYVIPDCWGLMRSGNNHF